MLIVKPLGGLANRMRVIAAAVDLAKEHNVEVECIWEASPELNAKYDDIFKAPHDFTVKQSLSPRCLSTFNRSPFITLRNSSWNKLFHGIDICLKESDVNTILGVGTDAYDTDSLFNYLRPQLSRKRNIFFSTCCYLKSFTDVSYFEPTDRIMGQIQKFQALNFSTKTYGLHIRRTDNLESIKHSPISLYINAIDEILSNDPDATFFLSTDDPDTDSYLQGLYGASIYSRRKCLDRNSREGIADAVIDMWLLSRTRKIYGSYYSSFSEMASLIGGTELKILANK